jgi:hypothetical protein
MSYKAVAVVAAGFLMLGLASLPYGYYTLLRLVVSAAALYGVTIAVRRRAEGWAITLAVVFLLFNPIIPVHLAGGEWALLDVVTAGIFVLAGFRLADTQA